MSLTELHMSDFIEHRCTFNLIRMELPYLLPKQIKCHCRIASFGIDSMQGY